MQKRKQERERWDKVRNNEESFPSEPEQPVRNTGAPTKPLWEQLKAQKEREEAMWMEEEKVCSLVLHAPKGLDDDELIFLEEQRDMKAALREQQQKEIEQYNQEVAQTVHTNEPTIVDELIRVKQMQKTQTNKKKTKLFVKVVPVQPAKRKTPEDSVF